MIVIFHDSDVQYCGVEDHHMQTLYLYSTGTCTGTGIHISHEKVILPSVAQPMH
jgi:hypothetical protein